MSANLILANNVNAVRSATLAASALLPSDDIALIAEDRDGYGSLAITGPYTGAEDTTIDVEILSGTGTELRPSTPVIAGIGNGTLTISGVMPAAQPERLVFTLADAGVAPVRARLRWAGVDLVAIAEGAAGNDITITVARDSVYSAPIGATLADLPAGTKELPDERWNFGAPPATGPGIPPDAVRLAFDGYRQVFRHWRLWRDGAWVLCLDPAPAWDIPADTAAREFLGGYEVTITDGTITEEYTAITEYDLLSQIKVRSSLIEIDGAVVLDYAPGGMAVTDVAQQTEAYSLPVIASISGRYGSQHLADIGIAADAVAENIRIECIESRPTLGDIWSVSGGASGALPNAITGTPYSAGPVSFTIPSGEIPAAERGAITAAVSLASRAAEVGIPAICVRPLRIGPIATPQSITFTYEARPPADCSCADIPDLLINNSCLGYVEAGGGGMALDSAYQTRLTSLYSWRATFIAAQTDLSTLYQIKLAPDDMDLCDRAVTAFADALASVYSDATAVAAWDTAFTALQSDLSAMSGVGFGSDDRTTFIAVGMKLGETRWHWTNGHRYRLERFVVGSSNDMGEMTEDFDGLNPLATWNTAGSTFTISGAFGASTAVAHFKDMGTAADLRLPSGSIDQLVRRYSAKMDHIRALAGIVPKSSASTSGGDSCWRDTGEAYWWRDDSGKYLPAFTNQPYVSARIGSGIGEPDGVPVATHEFGFGLIVACPERLIEGDRITITINSAAQGAYAVGDMYTIPIVGAAPAALRGGDDGSTEQTWAVVGSAGGAYQDWVWDPEDPSLYSAGPVEASLTQGGVPWVLGDRVTVYLEGGEMRWRVGSGSWTTGDLYAEHALGSGLTLQALAGAAPSFLTGDSWTYRAAALYGPDRLRAPRDSAAWAWSGATSTLDLDLGTIQPLGAIMLAKHTLPSGATISVSGGDAAIGEWTATVTRRDGPCIALLPDGRTARYLRLSIAGAGTGGAEIGWLWAGVPWEPIVEVSTLELVRSYGLERGSGLNPSGTYRGRGTGGRWSWQVGSNSALLPSDVVSLTAILDHVAEQGLEWVCLLSDSRDLSGAALVQIDVDAVTFSQEIGYRLADGSVPVSVDLPFRAVLE